MHIVVASGKGGTGKTTVAVNLAYVLSSSRSVTLADCDVEEPNLHLFFPVKGDDELEITLPVPDVDTSTCTLCGLCGGFCRYGALIVLADRVLQYPQLCHSCGGCSMVCPVGSISEHSEPVGEIRESSLSPSLNLFSGILREGSIHTTTVISAVRERVRSEGLVIIDAPPGTSCAAMETLEGCDFCLLVTEPTPFGLHDLKLISQLTKMYHIPAGVVINRSDNRDVDVETYCQEENIPVLMRIALDRTIALRHGSGQIISREDPVWFEKFIRLGTDVLTHAGA